MNRLNKRAAKENTVGYSPDRSPTGHAIARTCVKRDGKWVDCEEFAVSDPVYATQGDAIRAAARRWNCVGGAS